MYAPRASASTSSGWTYSRSIRSRTRRSRARSRRCCAAAGLLVTCAIMPRRTGVRWIARAPAATQAAACRASSSTDTGVAGWAAFVLSPLSAACSPTLVSIMATSCLANVGLRGGRVALIPARVILRRRGCLASRKASPRSGVGGQPCFDVTRPRACCDGDHYADNAGLAMGRRHRGEVCYPTISLTSSGFELSPRRTTSGNSSELRPATCGVLEVVSVEGFLTYLSERADGTRDW